MLKKLVEPIKTLLNVCNSLLYEKKPAKFFFLTGMVAIFFEKLFLTTS